MAASTERQRIQQALAWKLRMVRGARGNLWPKEPELQKVDHKISFILQEVDYRLRSLDKLITEALHEIK